jgi:fumarylacetoacetate (FAA) hydrolase
MVDRPTPDLPDLLEVTGGNLETAVTTGADHVPLADVFLAPPVLRPRAFLDFYTFEQHVRTCRAKRGLSVVPEWYEVPAYYNSNTSALYGHGQRVPFPREEDRLDFELELACVIGKRCRNVHADEAESVIAGYTILNDWSARSLQAKVMTIGLGPARGKDHASSLGPCLVSRDAVADVRDLTMRAYVNDQLWSEGNSGSSHYTFAQMIAFASRARTLYPGDVLGSGTVGTGCGLEQDRFLQPGDRVRLEIDGLGALENEIYYESHASSAQGAD